MINIDVCSNQHKAICGRRVVTTTHDEELQKAVLSIDTSYPLNDDEQIKVYVKWVLIIGFADTAIFGISHMILTAVF